MKVGDIVQEIFEKESNLGTGVIIEHESKDLYATTSKGITKMDIELTQQRHRSHRGMWRVLWSNGIMESCWGIDIEVVNG